MKRILCLGDTHLPYVTDELLFHSYQIASIFKPEVIVQVGDLFDMFAFSKFPRSQNVMTPKQEIHEGRAYAEKMWENLRKAAPKASCYQLCGNHDARPSKRLLERFPEAESLFHIDDLFKFKGVDTVTDDTQELVLDGVCYMHGYRSKLGDHAKFNLMPTVCGHSHTGGVVFMTIRDKIIWELNCGYMGDPEAKVMGYGKQKWKRWTLGYGMIDDLGPRFCPWPFK